MYSSLVSGQISRSFTVFAEAIGDPYDGDGIAEDDCAAAEFITATASGFDIDISNILCPQSGNHGEPTAIYDYASTIDHSATTSIKSYIGYTIPIGFSLSVNTDYVGTIDTLANGNFETSYGNTARTFQTSALSTLLDGQATLTTSTKENLMLTSDEFLFNFSYELKAINGVDEYVIVGAESTPIKLLLPSQFYLDNMISPPSTISIPTNTGSITFPVEITCAENIYLENGIDLDSYQYSSAALLSSSSTVKTNATVALSGGVCVLLEPGFTVDLGAEMETVDYIGCTN